MNIKRITQVCTEDEYSKKNIREKVRHDVQDSFKDALRVPTNNLIIMLNEYLGKSYYASKDRRVEFIRYMEIEDLVTEILMVCLSIENVLPIQGVAAKLGNSLGYDDIFDGVKTGAELLTLAGEVDIIDIVPAKESETGSLMVKSRYELDKATQYFIKKTMYLPPMVCRPNYVSENKQSGHLTVNNSVILGGSVNYHEERQALDVINIANGYQYSLDEEILKYVEEPKKECDTPEKIANHALMVSISRVVYEYLLENDNTFYMTHSYDKRGRLYSNGYHVNLQSSEYKKALMSFKKKEIIK